MKRVSQSRDVGLPPAGLYADDIDQLIEIVRAASSDGKVEISLPGYKLDSVSELAELAPRLPAGKIRELTLYAGDIYVYLYPLDGRVSVLNDTDTNVGIAAKVREYVSHRRKVLSPLRALVLFGVLGAATWLLPSELGYGRSALSITFSVLQVWCIAKDVPPYIAIYAVRRAEKPSFVARHGVQIGIALGGAVIGALAKRLFDLYF